MKNIQSIKTIKSNVQNLIVFPTNDPIVATDALSELSQKSENAFVLSCFDNNDLDVEYPSIVTKSISPNLRLGLRRKKVSVFNFIPFIAMSEIEISIYQSRTRIYNMDRCTRFNQINKSHYSYSPNCTIQNIPSQHSRRNRMKV